MILQVAPSTTPYWLELVRSPAAVIFSLGVSAKFLLAPALNTFMRRELQAELHQLAQFPLFVQRLEATEKAVAVLPDISQTLVRIEAELVAKTKE